MSHDIMNGWQATVPDNFKDQAACRGMDPELFMPTVGKHGKEAKEVCNGRRQTRSTPGVPPCPVKEQCLEYALSIPGIVVGVWGGLTERERRNLNRTTPVAVKRRFHHGTAHGYRLHTLMGTPHCDACKAAHTAANQAWRDKQRDNHTLPVLKELLETVTDIHRNAASRNAE